MKTADLTKSPKRGWPKPRPSDFRQRREMKRGVSVGLALLAAGVLALLYMRTL